MSRTSIGKDQEEGEIKVTLVSTLAVYMGENAMNHHQKESNKRMRLV